MVAGCYNTRRSLDYSRTLSASQIAAKTRNMAKNNVVIVPLSSTLVFGPIDARLDSVRKMEITGDNTMFSITKP